MEKGKKIPDVATPMDNKPKLITSKNSAGKGWLPPDVELPENFGEARKFTP